MIKSAGPADGDVAIRMSGRRCLITGATGFVGSWLADRLLAQGASVRCLVRPASLSRLHHPERVEVCLGDVTEPSSLDSALTDIDYVFHVAGLIKSPRESDYFRVNYLGTINLLEACRRVPRVPRIVVVSSQAAAGPSRPGQPIDEDSTCNPVTPYGKSKLLGESAAAAYRESLPIAVVRPPTVYGPRDRETLALFKVAKFGFRPRVGVPSAVSAVHVDDLVSGVVLAAIRDEAIGRTYFVAGDEQPSYGELVDGIAAAVGRRGIPIPVPSTTLRAAARAAEVARDVIGLSLIFDHWKAEEMLAGYWACSNQRAKLELGFEPTVRLLDGLRTTARWYRENGWL